MHKRHMHFIGIGGIGMSGIAKIILEHLAESVTVSGSDAKTEGSDIIAALRNLGAAVYQGHHPSNLAPSVTHVVVSSDISTSNPELVEAQKKGIPLLHRSDALASLMSDKKALLVSGTHGKTTTSSLLSHVLMHAGKDPSYAVGGIIKNYATNSRAGQSDLFVAEADESDGTFLKYTPYAAIVTNIDNDHLAHFGSIEAIEESFSRFCSQCPTSPSGSLIFACGDDPRVRKSISNGAFYGLNPDNDIVVDNVRTHEAGISFDISFKDGRFYSSISLPLFGEHNALNATAVFSLALAMGCTESQIRSGFESFQGVLRRLDCLYKGDNGIYLFDDYAHHPTEVKATLKAVRDSLSPRRIISVFQPHRPSRIKYIVDDFKGAFNTADILVLTDLYQASESDEECSALTQRLVETVASSHQSLPFFYFKKESLVEELLKIVRPYDVIVFMGAGDSTRLAQALKERMKSCPIKKYRVGLVYGGMNSENKISRVSAQAIWDNLRADLFEKRAFLVEVDGFWHDTTHEGICHSKLQGKNGPGRGKISPDIIAEMNECDILFPVLHGPYGEDGSIQGFFEMLRKPFASSTQASCAVAMDKAFSKQIAESIGIPVVPYIVLRDHEWSQSRASCLEKLKRKGLSLPLFIKPVHLGSSIGIEKVEEWDNVEAALDRVFVVDEKVVIEQGLIDFRELEFALLGNESPSAPPAGEILSEGRFYDYRAKYGESGIAAMPKSDLLDDVMEEGRALAKRIYQEMDLKVLTRVDFLLDSSGKWFFNEANPMPGFTEISLFPSIWKEAGMPFGELLSHMILYGFHRYRKQEKLSYNASEAGALMENYCVVS